MVNGPVSHVKVSADSPEGFNSPYSHESRKYISSSINLLIWGGFTSSNLTAKMIELSLNVKKNVLYWGRDNMLLRSFEPHVNL